MTYYDLTNPQKSIWHLEEYYKGTNINNICGTVTIKQNIDLDILNKAINKFIQNNKSFGLNFEKKDGKIVQYFTEQEDENFERVRLKDYKEVQKLAREISEKAINIYGKRLYNFVLYKLENGHGGFIVITHHIISDAATLALVGTEIPENYIKIIKNEEIPEKDYSYKDYMQAEKMYMNSDKFIKDENYWNTLFSNIPEVASIPSIKSNINLTGKANRKDFLLEKEVSNKITEFCKKNKISEFNFFMAVYAIYLSKVSNLRDFVIGTPILNRTGFKEKHTAGMFINTVPLRIKINDNIDFVTFVKQIAQSSLSMLRYQKYPYEMLLQNLRKKDSKIPTLFDVMLSFQVTKPHDKKIDMPYDVEWLGTSTISDGISIHLHYANDEDGLEVAYDYQIQKYDQEDIENIHKRILHIINQVLENENILEQNIGIITEEEKNKILYEFNNTFLEYNKDKTLIDYFEEQVKKHPNDVALVFQGEKLTYSKLNESVNSLARHLRNNLITNNSIVGVMLNRSLEMIISILAVLKSGGAYIPIDPAYPEERISYMLYQSKSNILITQEHLKNKIKKMKFKGKVIYADLTKTEIYSLENNNLEKISKPNDLSYIIYTSGSTGTPKGVMLTQQNYSNFVASMLEKIKYLKDGSQHSIASITTVSFDIFAFETLISLCAGLKIFITDEAEQKDTQKLEKLLKDNEIEIIQSTPSVMNFHLENSLINGFSGLKYIILAGEKLSKQLVDKIKKISPKCIIYNGYGPSETTIFSAVQDVTNLESITIGKPISNTQIYIFNKNLSLLPPNTVGEIYIAGDGVGKGYLGRDDLTAKSYIPNPFKENSIMYKTGDLGLWKSDGTIECIGRIDQQVKLRGLRIELGEIEECISNFDVNANIKCATIVKKINNRDTLNAFISASSPVDTEKLNKFLLNKLPTYMVPNTYIFLEKLPLTPNGKIDKNALLEYEINIERKKVEARNEVDKFIIVELKNSLKINDISITDSFFEIGGDSLVAIKLCAKISEKYKINFTVQNIFEHPVIQEMTDEILLKDSSAENINIKKVQKKEYYHISSAQKRIYYSSKIAGEENILYNVPCSIIFDKKPDIKKLSECFEKLIEKHSSLRTYFEEIDGEIYQKVASNIDFKIEELTEQEKTIDEIMKDFVKPFDLSKAPLFRACIVKQKNMYLLLLDIHHIICDGESLSIFTNELSKLYGEENFKEISEKEKNKIIYEFNNTKMDYPKNKTVINYFEEQVRKNPKSIALIFEEKSFSYEELNNKANQLGKYLIKNNIKSKEIVGIMVHRSPEMIISILAILKIGATYLPIDPQYPLERINYMLADSGTKNVLVHSATLNLDIGTNYKKINVDLKENIFNDMICENINYPIKLDDLIYLIYTSGSTGTPKGVKISHKNIVNFILGEKQYINFSPNKTMISVTTFCFDIFALEIWGALTSGMKLVLANDMEQLSPLPLKNLCEKHNVSMIQTTPSRFSTLFAITENTNFWKQFTDIMVGRRNFS